MPRTRVVIYQERPRGRKASVPLVEWLDTLPPKAQEKCRARLGRLRELGWELRRPEADFLQDGVYELRAKHAAVNYRILYFFYGGDVAVVIQGFIKQEASVPEIEIARAVERRRRYEADPATHTFGEA